jgi:hypothetical protein
MVEGDYISRDEEEIVVEDFNEDQVLSFTQRLRQQLVKSMMPRGAMPEDNKDRVVLLQTLRDMDHTALSKLKINVEEKGLQDSQQIQDIVRRIAELNPGGPRSETPVRDHIPEPDLADLPEVEFTESQKKIGLVTENSKEFLARMGVER